MIRNFFNNPGRWTPEQQARMRRFAEVRRKYKPSLFQCHLNPSGQIEREYWGNQGGLWPYSAALEIRDAMMPGRQPSAPRLVGETALVFAYADGSQVYFRFSAGQVYTILAVGPGYQPGNMGALPPGISVLRQISPRP